MTSAPSAAHARPAVSRHARVLRGTLGAAVVAVLAAVSHSFAGGSASLGAVALAAVITAPLCVALAGRMASLWRLSLAVGLSQFCYHWFFASMSFAGVAPHSHFGAEQLQAGAVSTSTGTASLAGALPDTITGTARHALHLATPGMVLMHALAAALTVLLLLHGDRAALRIGELVAGIALTLWALPAQLPARPATATTPRTPWRAKLTALTLAASRISRRGPPLVAA